MIARRKIVEAWVLNKGAALRPGMVVRCGLGHEELEVLYVNASGARVQRKGKKTVELYNGLQEKVGTFKTGSTAQSTISSHSEVEIKSTRTIITRS